MDKPEQVSVASLEFRKKAEKNQQIIGISLFIFLVVAVLIIYFDLGEFELFGIFSEAISAIVPSISKTAILTPSPKSSALVLSLTWALIPIALYWMFQVGDLRNLKAQEMGNGQKRGVSIIKRVLLVLLGIAFLTGVFYGAPEPDDSLKFTKMISTPLAENRYFIAIYGMVLWLVISALIWGLTVFVGLAYIFLKRE